jgi:hypothetical protein
MSKRNTSRVRVQMPESQNSHVNDTEYHLASSLVPYPVIPPPLYVLPKPKHHLIFHLLKMRT